MEIARFWGSNLRYFSVSKLTLYTEHHNIISTCLEIIISIIRGIWGRLRYCAEMLFNLALNSRRFSQKSENGYPKSTLKWRGGAFQFLQIPMRQQLFQCVRDCPSPSTLWFTQFNWRYRVTTLVSQGTHLWTASEIE